MYRQYFALLVRAARSGLFQIMAHPDLIKVMGHKPSKQLDVEALYDAAADAFLAGGAAINAMCRQYGMDAHVVDVGIAGAAVEGVRGMRVANGTRNFAIEPAIIPAMPPAPIPMSLTEGRG